MCKGKYMNVCVQAYEYCVARWARAWQIHPRVDSTIKRTLEGGTSEIQCKSPGEEGWLIPIYL